MGRSCFWKAADAPTSCLFTLTVEMGPAKKTRLLLLSIFLVLVFDFLSLTSDFPTLVPDFPILVSDFFLLSAGTLASALGVGVQERKSLLTLLLPFVELDF